MNLLSLLWYCPSDDDSDGVWDVLESTCGDPILAKLCCHDDDIGEADVFYLGNGDSSVTVIMTTVLCEDEILRLLILKGKVEPDTNGRICIDEDVQSELPFEFEHYSVLRD